MYVLTKALGGPIVSVLDESYDLFRELELYAAADIEARNRAKARERRREHGLAGSRRRGR